MRLKKVSEPGTRLRKFFSEATDVHVAVEVIDNQLKKIVLHGSCQFTGGEDRLVIKAADTYSASLCVFELEPPEMVQKWALRGTFFGNPFERVMDYEHEAITLRTKMCGSTDPDDVVLTVEPVQVPVEKPE